MNNVELEKAETEIEISDYNNSIIPRKSEINYSGNPLNIDSDKVFVTKFKITSSSLPVWIPNIIAFNSSNSYVPDTSYTQITFTPNITDWITDLSICIVNDNNKKYVNVPIIYTSYDSLYPKNSPIPGTVPGRGQVLNNTFFHTYTTLTLIELIQTAVNTGLDLVDAQVTNDIKFISSRNETQYEFFLLNAINPDNVKIYFNYNLKLMFNLNYRGSNNEFFYLLKFNKSITFQIENVNYYPSNSISFTTRIYPFMKLLFSGDLRTKQINRISSANLTSGTGINEIFSYYLTIADADGVAGTLEFEANTYFKGKTLYDIVNSIKVDIYFRTDDGYYVPLILYFKDSITLELEFI